MKTLDKNLTKVQKNSGFDEQVVKKKWITPQVEKLSVSRTLSGNNDATDEYYGNIQKDS